MWPDKTAAPSPLLYTPDFFSNMRQKGFEYRRVIIIGGILGLMASLGFGRFALGMMLPALGEALQLDYSQMGWIGTINFSGYLGAVVLCGELTARLGSRKLIALALGLVGLSMMAIGLSRSYGLIVVLYFLTGVGSALSNVPIVALVGSWFGPRTRGRAIGFCVMGNGLAILISGKLVPILNGSAWGWRTGWLVFGAVVALIACICGLLFRNPPGSVSGGSAAKAETATRELASAGKGIFYYCGLIYFLYGFTYIIYVTFFVTSLVQDRGMSEAAAGWLWSWLGLISLVSGPLFGYLSDRLGRKIAMLAVFFTLTVAYLLMAGRFPLAAVYISIGCFGLGVWAIPVVMAAIVADFAGPQRTAAMFGLVTFFFCLGQIGGPAVAGMLAQASGSMFSSFLLAGVLGLAAAGSSIMLPRRSAPA